MFPVKQTVPGQLPLFYQKEGPNFIAFLQAYYEWMQSEGNPLWTTHNLRNINDIDKTLDEFLYHFQNEVMNLIPGDIAADPRLVMKHIVDLYRAKGSKRGIELLFRIVFNEDIKLYLPGKDIFTLSDNQWVQPVYLEVSTNQFLPQLVGQQIYSSSQLGTALVESFNQVTVNNILVNVLTISHVTGEFHNGEFVLCDQVSNLTAENAPMVTGSLSAISVLQGGENLNVGDLLQVKGVEGGSGALAKIVSTKQENGEVDFTIVDGGFGFSLNAIVSVTGGNGTGATFQVGSITNRSILNLNTDLIENYYNTALEDNSGPTFVLSLTGTSGTFDNDEVVNASANAVTVDFAYLSGSNINLFETLSNTTLGISVNVAQVDNPSYAVFTGGINNANLIGGIKLIGLTSANVIYLNAVYPQVTIAGNGIASTINSTSATISNAIGYFLPSSTLEGVTSGATANIHSTTRLTNWVFPLNPGNTNLDTPLIDAFTVESLTVGTISSLRNVDPGELYSSNPTVSVTEPLVTGVQIPDGRGGYWGEDANIIATATSANGIATAVSVIDSGFGFLPGTEVILSSANNATSITGVAIVDSQGISQGYWTGKQSFLSDTNFLYDSSYYQQFSYEIWAPLMLNKYQQLVENVVGPAGYLLFGRFYLKSTQNTASRSTYYHMNQS